MRSAAAGQKSRDGTSVPPTSNADVLPLSSSTAKRMIALGMSDEGHARMARRSKVATADNHRPPGCSRTGPAETSTDERRLIGTLGKIDSEHATDPRKIAYSQLTAVRFDAPSAYGESKPQTCSLSA